LTGCSTCRRSALCNIAVRERLWSSGIAGNHAGESRRHCRDMPADLRDRPSGRVVTLGRFITGTTQPRHQPLVRRGKRFSQVPNSRQVGRLHSVHE